MTTFQKRHFEFIAGTLREMRQVVQGDTAKMIHDLYAEKFARELRHTNPNFKRDTFMRAAGMGE